MRNYLIINGVDSRDYGVYISGQGTFSAPERAYEFYSIPGRNGALIGNEKRLENIAVTYPAFIFGDDFSEKVANFRSFLLSNIGYQRIEDSYHPDEFRMGVYVGPFEPEVTQINDAGQFDITFNCKPQRYLKDGETTYTYGTSSVISGKEVSVNGAILDPTYFTVNFDSVRSGYATTSNPKRYLAPTGIRVKINGTTVTTKMMTVTNNYQVSRGWADLVSGLGTASCVVTDLPSTNWTAINTQTMGGQNYTYFRHSKSFLPTGKLTYSSHYRLYTGTTVDIVEKGKNTGQAVIGIPMNLSDYITVYDPQFPYGANVSKFQQWISAQSSAHRPVWVETNLTNPVTITMNSPYTPVFPAERIMISAELYPQASYDLFTEVSAVKVKYAPTDDMENPSVFPSKPLIRAFGNGSFTINDITITVTDATDYTDIDCDLMDCYEGAINRNNDVTFSTYDFPELQPGSNHVEIVSGITTVEITPRWWRL